MWMFQDANVKRGLWTNWSKGAVMGRTITIEAQAGTVIVSLLAILSSLALTHLWHIIAFAIHQSRAQGGPSDGLFWQQQAILRAQAAPSDLIADNLHLWWNWRTKTTRVLLRCCLQLILPTLFILGALAATISTSFIVDNSNIEVLVSSPLCGRFPSELGVDYLTTIAEATACRNSYVRPTLIFPIVSKPAPCPFAPSMCTNEEFSAVSIDTGLLDLTSDFGVNLRTWEAMKYRKVTTCSVIPVQSRIKILHMKRPRDPWDEPVSGENSSTTIEQTVALALGNSTALSAGVDLDDIIFMSQGSSSQTIGLQAVHYPSDELLRWTPLPDLMRKDAHVSVIQIEYPSVTFTKAVDDPLFPAHRNSTNAMNNAVFKPDFPVGAMGCTEQFQYCISRPSQEDLCTELGLDKTEITSDEFTGASPTQLTLLELLIRMPRMEFAITKGLNLSLSAMPIDSASSTQWVNEATSWSKYLLASTQIILADFALGPGTRSPSSRDKVLRPDTEGEKTLCGAQKMRKPGGFANINLFGLLFAVITSITFIVVDLTLLKVLVYLSNHRRGMRPRLNRWIQDGVLQLQRCAFEAEGKGTWEKLENDIPVTTYGERLSELSREMFPNINEIIEIKERSASFKKGHEFVRIYSMQESIKTARSMFGRVTQVGAKS